MQIGKSFQMGLLWLLASSLAFGQKGNQKKSDGRDDVTIAVLRRLDRNGDGKVSPSEVPLQTRPTMDRIAKKYHLDAAKTISIDKIASRSEKSDREDDRYDRRRDYRRDDRDREDRWRKDSSRSSQDDGDKNGKRFGARASTKVRGFGRHAGPSIPLEEKYASNVIKYVDSMLNRYDRNKNSILDKEEWRDVRWTSPPEASDKNKDNRLNKEELCARIEKKFFSKERENKESEKRDREKQEREKQERAKASYAKKNSSDGKDEKENYERVRRYAEGMHRRYDRNKNGRLEKDEWDRLKGDPNRYDRNRDRVLSVDELAVMLSDYSKSKSANKEQKKDSKWSRHGDKKNTTQNGSYRSLSAHERLPSGLPSYFLEKDTNQDGQIMMSEFASKWSQSTVEEFSSFDQNNDGVITPGEALANQKEGKR